jgi:hypothetical protein
VQQQASSSSSSSQPASCSSNSSSSSSIQSMLAGSGSSLIQAWSCVCSTTAVSCKHLLESAPTANFV